MSLSLKLTKYIPHRPTAKQAAFLMMDSEEAFYGGAAGGGKSDALLAGALQYVDVPGYDALLLRRTYSDLALPEALMDRANDWLGATDAHWNGSTKSWDFPSGATLTFGYLQRESDVHRYQSAAFQFCGLDELTQFSESQYRYMFSRLRRLAGSVVPLRMRSASNPGNLGHDWVKRRFIDEGASHGRIFVRATLKDNPHLDQVEYRRSLAKLDPITRAQLLDGDWSARTLGGLFRREWFPVVQEVPAETRWIRFWDLAATAPKRGRDPDHTAGVKLGLHRGFWHIGDVRRIRGTPGDVENLIAQVASIDGRNVSIRMEQEPGASGVNTIDHYRRRVLLGYDFRAVSPTGSKLERARPVSSAAEAGNIRVVEGGAWVGDFFDELEAFPSGAFDDQVDALSGAYAALARAGSRIPLHV